MNHSANPIRPPSRPLPRTPLARATIIATASLALLVAICSGSATAKATKPSALAFARCMRSHGIHNWPDPNRDGQFSKADTTLQKLAVTQSQLQTAQRACQHLYPGDGLSQQAEDQKMLTAMLNFARCMRAHGVNWPDPLAESDPGQPNTPGFPRNMPNINQNAPQVKHAMKACQHTMADIGYGKGGYP
jgi:hypothetical protein